MIIDVTAKYKPKGIGNTYNYNTSTPAGTVYVPTPPAIISFFDTVEPIIEDYQDNYAALYGDNPKVQLVTYDELGKRIYRSDQANITETADGLIDSISFDFAGISNSGFIILYPTV